MAKNKEKKPLKSPDSGEKYYCGECGAEVKEGHYTCGTCNNKIDWDKIKVGLRRF